MIKTKSISPCPAIGLAQIDMLPSMQESIGHGHHRSKGFHPTKATQESQEFTSSLTYRRQGRFRIYEPVLQARPLDSLYFGVEIEVSHLGYNLAKGKKTTSVLNQIFALPPSKSPTSYTGWQAVGETTIRSGCEFVSPILSPRHTVQVSLLMKSIAYLGHISIEQDAGIHVHVDASLWRVGQLLQFSHMMANIEPVLYPLLRIQPVRERQFCRSLQTMAHHATLSQPTQFAQMVAQAGLLSHEPLFSVSGLHWLVNHPLFGDWSNHRWFGTNINNFVDSKYAFADGSPTPKRTIEFRYFHAANEQDYVECCILLCCALMRYIEIEPTWTWDQDLFHPPHDQELKALWLHRILPRLPMQQIRQEMRQGYCQTQLGLQSEQVPAHLLDSPLMTVDDEHLPATWWAIMQRAAQMASK